MVTTKQQFALLYPSIPDALFRRLMMDETVAFLRDGKTIYGFRLTVDDDPLPGLVQIAVSKQHILAYVTAKEVILFPTVDVLSDATYQFNTITVEKVRVLNDTFEFEPIRKGTVAQLASEYLPPYKALDVSEETLEKMMVALTTSADNIHAMTARRKRPFKIDYSFGDFQHLADGLFEAPQAVSQEPADDYEYEPDAPVYGDAPEEHLDYPDEYPEDYPDDYPEEYPEEFPDDYPDDADYYDEPDTAISVDDSETTNDVPDTGTSFSNGNSVEAIRKERSRKLMEQWELDMFHSVGDVERYAILHLGVPSNTYNVLLNVLVQASGTFKSEAMLVEGVVKLLARAIETGKAE